MYTRNEGVIAIKRIYLDNPSYRRTHVVSRDQFLQLLRGATEYSVDLRNQAAGTIGLAVFDTFVADEYPGHQTFSFRTKKAQNVIVFDGAFEYADCFADPFGHITIFLKLRSSKEEHHLMIS